MLRFDFLHQTKFMKSNRTGENSEWVNDLDLCVGLWSSSSFWIKTPAKTGAKIAASITAARPEPKSQAAKSAARDKAEVPVAGSESTLKMKPCLRQNKLSGSQDMAFA